MRREQWRKFLCVLLVCTLFPWIGLAETSTADTLMEQINQSVAEIETLIENGCTFTYKGETYHGMNSLNYANAYLLGTEDYDPFCTALMDAQIALSNEVGELYLETVKLENAYAVQLGYDNYLAYTKAGYGIGEDAVQIVQYIGQQLPKTISLFANMGNLLYPIETDGLWDYEDLFQQMAAMYGKLSPDYQPILEELVHSDSFTMIKDPSFLCQDSTTSRGDIPKVQVVYIDELYLTNACIHEFGHYLHEYKKDSKDAHSYYSIYEINSCAGTLLCASDMEEYYREQLGDVDGAFATFRYLLESLAHINTAALIYADLEDIFLHPENYQPEDFAQLYLEQCVAHGYTGGYSEAFQMLLGSQWTTSYYTWLVKPSYLAAYALAYTHAIWLWYQQANGGNAVEIYNNLINTAIPDVSLDAYYQQMGLPDLMDPDMYAGLDDFVYDKMASLYQEAYGVAP